MAISPRVALITGSAKGLGRTAAVSLAEAGCRIVVNYVHSSNEASELVRLIEQKGAEALAVKADLTNRSELRQLVRTAEDAFGGVDILINNAGPFVRERRLFAEYSVEDIDALIQGNLVGAMLLDHMVLPGMRSKRWGRIIHFGFGHASEARGWPHRGVYAAAKVGLVSFTKTLAVEEAQFGITVNMICPGDIRGENKEKRIEEVAHMVDRESPRGRPGTGEDISRVILFISEDKADYFTGNIIEVGGGLDPIRTLPLT